MNIPPGIWSEIIRKEMERQAAFMRLVQSMPPSQPLSRWMRFRVAARRLRWRIGEIVAGRTFEDYDL